jgi:ABC-type bacteriocin/lantibiotic exporter with double-glycine peptidase domain
MSFILEGPETERLVMNEAYNLHYYDPMLTVVSLIMIPLLAGCLVIAFTVLRKRSEKLTV